MSALLYLAALISLSTLLTTTSSQGSKLADALGYSSPKAYQLGPSQFLDVDQLSEDGNVNQNVDQDYQIVWTPTNGKADGSQLDQSLGYSLGESGYPSTVNLYSQSETNQLVESLAKLREMAALAVASNGGDSPNPIPNYDVNSHWPASIKNPTTETEKFISGPVNDPDEFEAALSYFTNSLNYKIPNTINRSLILSTLMATDNFGPTMNQVLHESGSDTLETTAAKQRDKNSLVGLELSGTNKKNDNEANSDQDKDADDSDSKSEDSNKKIAMAVREASSSQLPSSAVNSGEYIDHPLNLVGHQYVQGGAGEGRQLLGPEGMFENVQVIKSDHPVPSYCNPPNPCPIGYTAEDGCLEEFINSASFSREYQAKQKCSCDNEHSLFNCESPTSATDGIASGGSNSIDTSNTGNGVEIDVGNEIKAPGYDITMGQSDEKLPQLSESKLTTLARAVMNRFGDMASIGNMIATYRGTDKEDGDKSNNSTA